IHCAACVGKVENSLIKQQGLHDVYVNPVNGRATLRWNPARVALSDIAIRLEEAGYPVDIDLQQRDYAKVKQKRSALMRIAVAGLGMMQVMMYAIATYIGALQDMDAATYRFMHLVSMVITTPVVFYSAKPFFKSAFKDLRSFRLSMDVPVSLAIGAAYTASVWSTLSGTGPVYFDSVVMFVFFLSISRYFELAIRHRVGSAGEALTRLLPNQVQRFQGDMLETVTIASLSPGDRVLVPAGERIPADGVIESGDTHVDEAMLTGESKPVKRGPGDRVFAGGVNLSNPVTLQVSHSGAGTVISGIGQMLEQAQTNRPRLAHIANIVAAYFTAGVLLLAALTAAFWYFTDPSQAFRVTLTVLVVTCPCALALAVPVAITSASARLVHDGILVVKPDAIETLQRVTDVVMDKTGSLTKGETQIVETIASGSLNAEECFVIAATLEQGSTHPLAHAFKGFSRHVDNAQDIKMVKGKGIQGKIAGRNYRIGSSEFVSELCGESTSIPGSRDDASWIALGDEQSLLAWFAIGDSLRDGATDLVKALKLAGKSIHLISGDEQSSVAAAAETLGIPRYNARVSPAGKLAYINKLQQKGRVVFAIGDGINDAPVLAGADVSLAMGSGTDIAQASADLIYMHKSLYKLADCLPYAKRAVHVIRQNLAWALIYNIVALPLAISGALQPWMAAIGMSASSLLVVGNALRLSFNSKTEPDRVPAVHNSAESV
ncbi:MAG: cadmium-translocating P-type ATPase, partial [Gammaproteobacteria bacterium]|nr:cadmium-translocating P-type ATPase [Gammaproteobacteria bacterium]